MSGVSRAAQQTLGLPPGFQAFSPFPFAGMNQSASRIAMADQEFWWIENAVKIGDGNYRTLWDAGQPLFTAPAGRTIVYFFFYNIGPDNYVAVFLSDGSAAQVAWPSGAVTTISATAGLFYDVANGQLPACSQFGAQYLVIGNNNTPNDYWLWDGKVLYAAGGIAPTTSTTSTSTITDGGAGYTSIPNYTVFGGAGSGVVLMPVIFEGSVVGLTVRHPGTGYEPGDIVQVAFSGGGSDTSPILEAVLASGVVEFVTVVAGGSGYAPGTYPLTFTSVGGSGAAGTFTVNAAGAVASAALTAGGSGYTSAPSVSFNGAGSGTGAVAVASLTPGAVASVNIISGGTNLTGTPTLTFLGGGGSGAVATCTVSGGVITAVSVSHGGSGYTSVPAVQVQSGLNNAAAATLQMMPFGVSGTTIETYQQRVWIGVPAKTSTQPTGGTFQVSAPGSLTDFATSDGGDLFTNVDRFLRSTYTFLRQTSYFLYAVGDSSVSVISNVQTNGNPATTTFSYQNADPQIGSPWRDTAQDFGNTILFANPFGCYGIYGGSVRKISGKVDDIFNAAVLPPAPGALTPTSAVANLYEQKVFLLLLTVVDPLNSETRNVMLGWTEKEWFIASQSPALTMIATQEVDSNLTAWGTDGTYLYPLFQNPSATLPKTFSTKLYGGQQPFMVKMVHSVYIDAVDVSAAQAGITFQTATIDCDGLAVPAVNSVTSAMLSCPSGSFAFDFAPSFLAPAPNGAMYGTGRQPQVPGISLGMTLSSTSPDFVLRNLAIGYWPQAAVA